MGKIAKIKRACLNDRMISTHSNANVEEQTTKDGYSMDISKHQHMHLLVEPERVG